MLLELWRSCGNIGAWLNGTLHITGQTRSQHFNAEKSSSEDKFEQGSSAQYIVVFNLVKLNTHLEKITHLKKFSSKQNWEQIKKLDLFCKTLLVNPVSFSV